MKLDKWLRCQMRRTFLVYWSRNLHSELSVLIVSGKCSTIRPYHSRQHRRYGFVLERYCYCRLLLGDRFSCRIVSNYQIRKPVHHSQGAVRWIEMPSSRVLQILSQTNVNSKDSEKINYSTRKLCVGMSLLVLLKLTWFAAHNPKPPSANKEAAVRRHHRQYHLRCKCSDGVEKVSYTGPFEMFSFATAFWRLWLGAQSRILAHDFGTQSEVPRFVDCLVVGYKNRRIQFASTITN